MTLEEGRPTQLAAIPVDSEGNAVHGLTAVWRAITPGAVSVSSTGEVIANATGVSVLQATVGANTATITVTVVARAGSALRPSQSSVGAGTHATLKATTRKARSVLFAHRIPPGSLAMPLGGDEAESVFRPANAIGTPPGKTTPGAQKRGAAVESTETPGSANFNFNLPVASLPGRGIDVGLSAVYNSRLWNKSSGAGGTTVMTYNIDKGFPAPGFSLGYGYWVDASTDTVNQIMLTDPDGTRHRMVYRSSSASYESDDGTFIRLKSTGPPSYAFAATYPDGTTVTYGTNDTTGRSYPTQMTDRHGNYITIIYTGDYNQGRRIFSIQDTLGRYIRFYYAANNELVCITAPGMVGQADRQVMRFYYETLSNLTLSNLPQTGSGHFQASVQVNGPTDARVIRYIYLPSATGGSDRIGYRYDYSSYGMIYQIIQWRGMTVSSTSLTDPGTVTAFGSGAASTTYNYQGTPINTATGLSDAPVYTQRSDDWAGRIPAMPVYQFSVNQATGVSAVTAPDNTVTETRTVASGAIWQIGLISDTIVKLGSTELSHTVYMWEPGPYTANPRLQKIETTNDAAAGDPNKTKAITFEYYTSYNNVSKVHEWGFAPTGTLGTELRRTETTYVTTTTYTDRGLIHLSDTVKMLGLVSGTMTLVSQTSSFYDETTPTPYGDIGTMNYTDPGTTARGNLTRTRQYLDLSTFSSWVDHTTTYDVAGNALTAKLDCCQQKSYSYPSSYFHGYPTSVTSGSGPTLTTSSGYDFNTGLTTSTTAENGQQHFYYYLVGSLKPEHVETGGVPLLSYNYNDALTNDLAGRGHYFVVTNTRLDATRVMARYDFYDGLDRVTLSFDNWTTVDGWRTQDIEYNAMGQAYRASNPYYCGGYAWVPINPDGYWTTKSFDSLGRIYSVSMPTGDTSPSSLTTVQTTYSGVYTTVQDQGGKQRRQKVDALGRVIRLDEPDASGNLGSVDSPTQATSYEYDPLDNLIHIIQGSQNRYFKYDSLSRLTYERQVEQDAPFTTTDSVAGNNQWSRKIIYNSHGLVTDSYGARQVRTQIDYDGLNRVWHVNYSGENPALTPNVTYTYDEARTGFYNQGQPTTITTAALGGAPQTTLEIDYEIFGRVASHRQKIGATTYTMTYGYNTVGLLTSETYPSGRVINNNYDEGGRLSSITDGTGATYASGLKYAKHGGLKEETFGNSFVHTMDYNSRLQPSNAKLSYGGNEQQRFDYSYGQVNQSTGSVDITKNNGQIGRIDGFTGGTKLWDQRFTYDSLARLSQSAEYQGTSGPLTYQAHYDYDIYGNRFQYQQNINLAYTTVQPADVDSTRNRFISTGTYPTTYDAAGNITADTKFRGMNYTYDANNRQRSASGTYTSQTSVYDARGQRVQTLGNPGSRQMVYDAFGQLIAEYKAGSLERENIYRAGQLLATQEFYPSSINVALSANGGTAVASSTTAPYYPNYANDGARMAINGRIWADGTYPTFPDWLEIDFNGSYTISEIDVVTQQDDYQNLVDPTLSQTFSLYGIIAFDVQYWNGSAWTNVSGGSVTGNNKVWRQFTFANITTSKIRIVVNDGADHILSRIVEVEAWTSASGVVNNVALNKSATQSSTNAPGTTDASKAVDGNTDGALWNGHTSATNWENQGLVAG